MYINSLAPDGPEFQLNALAIMHQVLPLITERLAAIVPSCHLSGAIRVLNVCPSC